MSTPPTPPAQPGPGPDPSTPSASSMPTDRPETDPFAFASNSPNQSPPAPANPGRARPSFDASGQAAPEPASPNQAAPSPGDPSQKPPMPANPSQAAPSPGGPGDQPPMPGTSRPSERFWPDAPNQIGGPYPYANGQSAANPRAGGPGPSGASSWRPFAQGGASDSYGLPGPQAPAGCLSRSARLPRRTIGCSKTTRSSTRTARG